MKMVRLGGSVILALFMLFMGSQKFGASNPVFSYLAANSGIELFEPVIRTATGVAEIVAALLLLAGVFVVGMRLARMWFGRRAAAKRAGEEKRSD